MSETKTTQKKAKKKLLLRALQPLFYSRGYRVIQENEVYEFVGDEPPPDYVAVPVDSNTPLGPSPEAPAPFGRPGQPNPSWTTPGFKEQALRSSNRADDESDQMI